MLFLYKISGESIIEEKWSRKVVWWVNRAEMLTVTECKAQQSEELWDPGWALQAGGTDHPGPVT